MDYFWLTLKHKWYVFIAGRKLGVPLWRLVKHDWTKFTLSEYPHYQRQFFGDKQAPGFASAWLHHQNVNDHHWEYWIPRSGHAKGNSSDNIPLPMHEEAAREMIADWFAACKAYDGFWPSQDNWPWISKNFHKIKLNPFTRTKVIELLKEQNIDLEGMGL